MADQVINPFQDVLDNPVQTQDNYGQPQLDNLFSLQIGAGGIAFKADQSGIWLGADKFVNAPFRVDMNGNVTATSLALSQYLSKAGTGQALSGSIVINDGTNDIILIGYQSGGF